MHVNNNGSRNSNGSSRENSGSKHQRGGGVGGVGGGGGWYSSAKSVLLVMLLMDFSYRMGKTSTVYDDSRLTSRATSLEASLASLYSTTTPSGVVVEAEKKSLFTTTEAGSTSITPQVDCSDLLRRRHEGRLGFADPNEGLPLDRYSRQTKLRQNPDPEWWGPPFRVAVHSQNFDYVRWGIMGTGRYYEVALERVWRQVLGMSVGNSGGSGSDETPIRVLDVGGNIGYFTLLSLAMGRRIKVDTFEPNPVNHLRLCESLQLNGWLPESDDSSSDNGNDSIRLHAAGVSDAKAELAFFVPKNPGAARFYPVDAPFLRGRNYTVLPLITLDDFAESRGWFDSGEGDMVNIAILKIDVEGLDSQVLRGAQRLLESKLVRNVFMEVFKKSDGEKAKARDSLEMIVGAGYRLAGWGTWQGPGNTPEWPQDERLIDNLLGAEPESRGLNLWWSLDDEDSNNV